MKTISELNSKTWYRLIKVIYIFIFLIAGAISIGVIFENNGPKYDNNNSYIKCSDGQKIKIINTGEKLYSDYVYSWQDERFRSICLTRYSPSDTNSTSSTDKIEVEKYKLTRSDYTLTSFYTDRSWVKIIGKSLISLVLIAACFEMIRRVFYYIVLGKLKPPKN